MNMPLLNLEVRVEYDVVLARQRARQIAGLLGFAQLDQTRVATATSEIARNSVKYAGGGRVEFSVEANAAPAFVIRFLRARTGHQRPAKNPRGRLCFDDRAGAGNHRRQKADGSIRDRVGGRSRHGLYGEKPAGSRKPLAPHELARISAELAKSAPRGLLEELQQQNQELFSALHELRESQAELALMHSRELDETNRGVLALYAELDEGAKSLQRLPT